MYTLYLYKSIDINLLLYNICLNKDNSNKQLYVYINKHTGYSCILKHIFVFTYTMYLLYI